MKIAPEQLNQLCALSPPELRILFVLVVLPRTWTYRTRDLERMTGMARRQVQLALVSLEDAGYLRRRWRGDPKDPRATFFLDLTIDRATRTSISQIDVKKRHTDLPDRCTSISGIDAHRSPGSISSTSDLLEVDPNLIRPSVRDRARAREALPQSTDGRTDGDPISVPEPEISERVARVFARYWPGVPRVALDRALVRLAAAEPTDDELVEFFGDAYHGRLACFEGVERGENRFGCATTFHRFRHWRRLRRAPKAKPIADAATRSGDAGDVETLRAAGERAEAYLRMQRGGHG